MGRVRNRDRWLLAGAFGALYLVSLSFNVGVLVQNHAIQVPLMLRLARPGLIPEDAFTATLGGYASLVWYAAAPLARVVPLEPLLLLLLFAERALALYAFGRLAAALSGGSRTALVAGWLFAAMVPRPFVGDGVIVGRYFEQTGLAVALAVLATAALVEGRTGRFALLLGLAFDANPLYGVFALSYSLPLGLGRGFGERRRSFLPALGAAVVIGAPALVIALSARGAPASPVLWLRALRALHPYHFFPDTWAAGAVARLALFLLVAGGVCARAARRLRSAAAAWIAISVAWLGLAVLNAYVLRLPNLFVLQPARAPDVGVALLGVAALSALAAAAEEPARRGPGRWISALLLSALPVVFFGPAPLLVVFAVVLLGLELAARRFETGATWPANLQLALVIGVVPALGLSARAPLPWLQGPGPAVRAAAAWVSARTAPEAVFLVDPDPSWDSFRVLARRRPFVFWKDGAAMLWRKDFAETWMQRMRLLGWDITRDGRTFAELHDTLYASVDEARVRQIRRAGRLDYWIARQDQATRFPVVFQSDGWKIVAVGD